MYSRLHCILGETEGGCKYLYLFVNVFAFVGVLQCILVQSISLQCIFGETGGGCEYLYLFVFVLPFVGALQCILV